MAKLVSKKNIPIVIATNGNIDLENIYAISLQKNFYENLSNKQSFRAALAKAVAAINIESAKRRHIDAQTRGNDYQTRGEGASDEKRNDLQIIQNSLHDDTDFYLIPPGIRETIDSIDDLESLLLVYYQDKAILDVFKEQMQKEGYDALIRVVAINKDDCATLQKSGWTIGMKMKLKILMLLSVEENLNEHFKQLFDNPSLFKSGNTIRLALSGDVRVNQAVLGAKHLGVLTQDNRLYFHFNGVRDLFKHDPFLTFLTYEEVEYGARMKYTYFFSCDPSKDEVKSHEPASAHFFYLQNTQPKVASFLINFLRYVKEIKTPNIIIHYKSGGSESLLNIFEKGIQEHFDDKQEWKLRKLISELLKLPYVVIIHLEQADDAAAVVESLNDIIKSFCEAIGDYKEKTSTFVFILHNVELSQSLPASAGNLMTLHVSNPKEISEENVVKWREGLVGVEVKEANRKIIVEAAQKIDLTTDKTPPVVIAKICEVFRIPGNKILSVS